MISRAAVEPPRLYWSIRSHSGPTAGIPPAGSAGCGSDVAAEVVVSGGTDAGCAAA